MKFTATIGVDDNTPSITVTGATQEQADTRARYVASCILKFRAMPQELIDGMPESGVPGLAIECANLIAFHAAVESAAKDDGEWAALRKALLSSAVSLH